MKSRRALSTVVGAVFAIIALTSTVTYVSYSMGILDNYNQSVLTKNQQLSDVNKERFQISSVTVPNNKFNITVVNTGSVPINFTKIWLQNTTTAATRDWVRSYVPTHNFVAPGGILTNIGQSINVISANSYNVKLVTSRGNTQQFVMNSPSAAPLNIQLLAFPPSVSSGFNSQLTMIVTNNGSSTLTNILPNDLPTTSPGLQGSATCVASSVSPSKYDTLAPGSTAIFTWSVTATGNYDGDSCTYILTTPLKNGYAQTVQTKITVSKITFSDTLLAANTGVLTIDYTSWKYTQGSGWKTFWSMPHATGTAFALNLTNNDPTKTFYISNKTALAIALSNSNANGAKTAAYILYNATSTGAFTKYTCPGSPNYDYCVAIPPHKSFVISIGGDNIGTGASNSLQPTPNPTGGGTGPCTAFLLLYGKFDTSPNGNGAFYAQNVPFIAVFLT